MLNYAKAYILYPAAETYLKRNIRSKLSELRELHHKPTAERLAYQQKKLHQVLLNAQQNVPYYRDLFATIGFDPSKILRSLSYLQEIPVLTKDILREQGARLLNDKIPHNQIHVRSTNGSTGLVTTVWYDHEGLDWTAAVNLFASELSGRKHVDTEVHLSSKFHDASSRKELWIEQVKCWSLNRVNVHTHTFDDQGLAKLYADLKRARPYSIQGHPSTLYFLALYVRKKGIPAKGLFKAFQSTGESLDKSKFELIQEVFGCQINNRYGNAEFGVVACSRGDFNELEVLDSIVFPESHSLGNGLEELVLTGLTNQAMPLIRYKTGDVGEVSFKNGHYVISRLVGRVHDLVELNGQTYPTHYIKDILERMGGLDEFQIVQNGSSDYKVLKIVPNQFCDRARIETRVKELFGEALRIEYTGFDGLILQGWRDKFRYLVKQAQ